MIEFGKGGNMKKLGCGVTILGILAISGGGVLTLGVHLGAALEANRVAAVPLVPGEEKTTDTLKVSTEESCQIGVYLDLTTKSVEVLDPGDYVANYRFPVRYKVLNAKGATVFSEDTCADQWRLTVLLGSEEPLDKRGREVSGAALFAGKPPLVRLRIEHRFAAFRVPPPGDITIEIEVEPDTKYEATASRTELRVYDNLAEAGAVGARAALFVGGGLLVMIGLGLGAFADESGAGEAKPSAPSPPPQSALPPGGD